MVFQTESPPPTLPRFGDVYSRTEHDRLVRSIEILISLISADGALRATTLRLTNLPTSPAGLRSGDVWANGTVLEIVP